jgi:hypothetical protein
MLHVSLALTQKTSANLVCAVYLCVSYDCHYKQLLLARGSMSLMEPQFVLCEVRSEFLVLTIYSLLLVVVEGCFVNDLSNR